MDLANDRTRTADELELRWFEAHRAALTAQIELLSAGAAGGAAPCPAAEELAKANSDKLSIMGRLEALEDALVREAERRKE
jgi:hypothetical protein